MTVRLVLITLVPGVVVGVALAPYLLRIFGATYAEHGTTLLRLLLLALPGTAVTSFFTSFLWLERRMLALTCRQLADAMVFLGATLLLMGHFGLLAVGIASLATEALQAVIFLPGAIGRYRIVRSETGWRSRDVWSSATPRFSPPRSAVTISVLAWQAAPEQGNSWCCVVLAAGTSLHSRSQRNANRYSLRSCMTLGRISRRTGR